MKYLYTALIVAAIFALLLISIYNRLRRLNLGVKESFAAMDVFLKKRYDLVPNLVASVKGYATHEREVFEQTAEARAKAMGAKSTAEKAEANQLLQDSLQRLIVIAEDYPELKADGGFLKLQKQLEEIEDDIADSRLYYNGNVKLYNANIQTFPNLLVAPLFGYRPEDFFSAEGSERAAVPTFKE